MKYITKLKLSAVHQLCDAEDVSTEKMYAYMENMCKVDADTINSYMVNENHAKLFDELNELTAVMIQLGN
jgi:hypothetical protein